MHVGADRHPDSLKREGIIECKIYHPRNYIIQYFWKKQI